jgi:amidase
VTELLPSRALQRARWLDDALRENNKPTGRLHGIPISVKSHIGIKDCRVPAGYVGLWGNIAPRDALIVQILEREGGIIHARTTEPQSMMQLECASNLYGVTVNPYNTSLSSGGSSGGEGALLALGGSVIGIGSDVGGSIRVPAAACGIYGFKPTANRIPTLGWSSTPPGADPIQTVIGPMSKSLDGIETFMQVALDAKPWTQEPVLIPFPWRSANLSPTAEKPIRIGIMWHDGVVLPHPPVTRTLKEFVDSLEGLPYLQTTEFSPYKHDEGWAIISSLYITDGGKADSNIISRSGEPWLPLTEWIIKQNQCVKDLTREELEYWLEEREEYKIEYNQAWNTTGIWNDENGQWENAVDVIICPVGPGVATRHRTAKYWPYTAIWNLLDYPALSFPHGTSDKSKDLKQGREKYMSGLDEDNWELCRLHFHLAMIVLCSQLEKEEY